MAHHGTKTSQNYLHRICFDCVCLIMGYDLEKKKYRGNHDQAVDLREPYSWKIPNVLKHVETTQASHPPNRSRLSVKQISNGLSEHKEVAYDRRSEVDSTLALAKV